MAVDCSGLPDRAGAVCWSFEASCRRVLWRHTRYRIRTRIRGTPYPFPLALAGGWRQYGCGVARRALRRELCRAWSHPAAPPPHPSAAESGVVSPDYATPSCTYCLGNAGTPCSVVACPCFRLLPELPPFPPWASGAFPLVSCYQVLQGLRLRDGRLVVTRSKMLPDALNTNPEHGRICAALWIVVNDDGLRDCFRCPGFE